MPPRAEDALDKIRALRDAMDQAVGQVAFKECALRVGLEISQERKEELNTFFRAHDSLQQHLKDIGLEANLTPCVATIRLHGPAMHVLGSLSRPGTWQWRQAGFDAEKLVGPPPDRPEATPTGR